MQLRTIETDKASVSIDSKPMQVEVIFYRGFWWMIPGWRQRGSGVRHPARLIKIPEDRLVKEDGKPIRVIGNISSKIFSPIEEDWESSKEFEVSQAPELVFEIGDARH